MFTMMWKINSEKYFNARAILRAGWKFPPSYFSSYSSHKEPEVFPFRHSCHLEEHLARGRGWQNFTDVLYLNLRIISLSANNGHPNGPFGVVWLGAKWKVKEMGDFPGWLICEEIIKHATFFTLIIVVAPVGIGLDGLRIFPRGHPLIPSTSDRKSLKPVQDPAAGHHGCIGLPPHTWSWVSNPGLFSSSFPPPPSAVQKVLNIHINYWKPYHILCRKAKSTHCQSLESFWSNARRCKTPRVHTVPPILGTSSDRTWSQPARVGKYVKLS